MNDNPPSRRPGVAVDTTGAWTQIEQAARTHGWGINRKPVGGVLQLSRPRPPRRQWDETRDFVQILFRRDGTVASAHAYLGEGEIVDIEGDDKAGQLVATLEGFAPDYPNRGHADADQDARRRALAAMDTIGDEVAALRRKLEHTFPTYIGPEDTQAVSDAVRALTARMAELAMLGQVREWHAADRAGEQARHADEADKPVEGKQGVSS